MAQIIQDLTLLLIVSLPINLVFHKARLPSVMGYLLAGVLIGPHGLGWVGDVVSVRHLAEIGIILLLFLIGLEFSLSHLLRNIWRLLGTGGLQLGLTTGAVFLCTPFLGLDPATGLLVGVLAALSSTALVVQMITDRAEIDTSHGRVCIGVLLFQDLCVVPLMLLVPLMAHMDTLPGWEIGQALLKSAGAVAGIFFASRLLVPRALRWIAQTGRREHLTLFVILVILGTGWVSQQLGLTLAMGAFLAGMIISESEYQHQITLDILPVKDYFGSIFFISVGMLLEVSWLWEGLAGFLALGMGIMILKAAIAFLSAWLMRLPLRTALAAGIYLAQVGEFSLILADLAQQNGVLTPIQYQAFLIVSLLSLLTAPLLIQRTSNWVATAAPPAPAKGAEGSGEVPQAHVIIAGYGRTGRHLARLLLEIRVPFLIVDWNGEHIKQAITQQAPVLYGDARHRGILQRANIAAAKALVVALPDLAAAQQVVLLARQLNPALYILVRARQDAQVEPLTAAGADLVIPEAFETSIEIFARVLKAFRIPTRVIEQQVELVRLEGYSMFRGLPMDVERLRKFSTYLAASLTESVPVEAESWSREKRVRFLNLKSLTGARLIAVVRGHEVHPNPEGDFLLREGDQLILFGRHAQLGKALRLVREGPANADPTSGDP